MKQQWNFKAVGLWVLLAGVLMLGGVGCSGERTQTPPAPPTPPGPSPKVATTDLSDAHFNTKLKLVGPYVHRNLTLFYLVDPSPAVGATDYLTLDVGVKNKLVAVTEQDNAQVRALLIQNKSDKLLFIASGELVRGGQQDRTFPHSIVIPPSKTPTPIPSLCVEASRWNGGKDFGSDGYMLGNGEQIAAKTGNQSGVWQRVASKKGALRANSSLFSGEAVKASRTTSMNEELNDKDIQALLKEYSTTMKAPLGELKNVVGLAYAVDGKPTAVQVVESPALFEKVVGKFLNSAVSDAVAGKVKTVPKAITAKDIESFIAQGFDGKKTETKLPFGNVVLQYLAKATITSQLTYKAKVVHVQIGAVEAIARQTMRGTGNQSSNFQGSDLQNMEMPPMEAPNAPAVAPKPQPKK